MTRRMLWGIYGHDEARARQRIYEGWDAGLDSAHMARKLDISEFRVAAAISDYVSAKKCRKARF